MSDTMTLKFGREPVDFDSSEKINKKYRYVEWGKKNDYPFKLIDMVQRSAVHQGIINTKVSYITGGGFVTENPQIEEVINNGSSDYSLNEVVERCSYDFEIFNMFAFRGVWNRAGDRVAYLEHVDMDKLRESGYNDNLWYYSDDWSESRQSKEKTGFKTYRELDLNDKTGEFLLVYKSPSKRNKDTEGIYSTPVYSGGLDAIQTDIEISRFHLQEILNGFSGGTIINVPTGAPTTEEEKSDARKFKDNLTGSVNAGEVFINFSNGTEDEIKVIQISGNDLDKRYEMLDKSTMQKIIISHSVTSPILMGVKTEGQIGGTTELDVSFQIFKNTYIKKRQQPLNEVFTYVMNTCYNVEGVLELEEAKTPFDQGEVDDRLNVINSLSPIVANSLLKQMTINEVRGINNLPPIEGGNVIPNNTDDVGTEQGFQSKKDIVGEALELFASCGKSIDNCKFVSHKQLDHDLTDDQIKEIEADYTEQLFNDIEVANAELKNTNANILRLLKRGDSVGTIAMLIDDEPDRVVRKVKDLIERGYIDDSYNPTERGERLLELVDSEVDDYEVRYTYEKRAGVPGTDIIPTTRDFCRELINLNRAYTREEISTISARVGRDVWRLRGGWYHNPQTDQTTPFCRHVWTFVLTRK